MKKLGFAALLLTISLWAADFWQSKPFGEWSDKDVQKMLDNSPWSKAVNVATDLVPPSDTGKRSGGRAGMGEIGNPSAGAASPIEDAPAVSTNSRPRAGDPGSSALPSMTFIVRWESSLPVREARMRAKYGAEATTSPESKKILDAVEPSYVITVSGLPRNALRGDPEDVKKQVLARAALTVKGKDPIRPVNFMMQRATDGFVAVFAFPKTTALSVEDKEVEFSASFESLVVKQRFPLKTMVVNGKLEL